MMLDEVVPLALLPQLAFFATCHRAAIASVGSFSRQHARLTRDPRLFRTHCAPNVCGSLPLVSGM